MSSNGLVIRKLNSFQTFNWPFETLTLKQLQFIGYLKLPLSDIWFDTWKLIFETATNVFCNLMFQISTCLKSKLSNEHQASNLNMTNETSEI